MSFFDEFEQCPACKELTLGYREYCEGKFLWKFFHPSPMGRKNCPKKPHIHRWCLCCHYQIEITEI